jgi:sulfopyruvate decarboxylase TPP-binding subunit
MTSLSARTVLDSLLSLGVTDVLGIPDNSTAALFDLLATDERLDVLCVTREGEAFAIASGLWLGGRCPVVCIQGTGLLESGDSLRGTASRMGIPLLCLIGYRGYAKMVRANLHPDGPHSLPTLRRLDVDSVALHLEPTLRAWEIPHWKLTPGNERSEVEAAWSHANDYERPVALLIPSVLS